MPRQKTLFFIGVWVIILSNFIGLPTEIKNYLFIATAVLIIVFSYSLNNSKNTDTENNIFYKRKENNKIDKPDEGRVKKSILKPRPISTLKKRDKDFTVELETSLVDKGEDVFKDFNSSYLNNPVVKVRRARIKPKSRLPKPESLIESNFNLESEEDDVVVISSDRDMGRE